MSKTVIEYVWGDFLRDGEIAYSNVKLKLTVRVEDSIPSQIVREVVNHELARIGVVKDGELTLRYVFDGKQQECSVRVQGRKLVCIKAKGRAG